jgi:tRNA pseudouridine55 synthase
VLPLCVGKATRLARFLSGAEKEYRASVRLGFATTTDDATGEPLGVPRPCGVADAELREALASFVGTLDQVPPSFSAKRVAGRRAYELARRGESVPRAAATVTVHAIALVARAAEVVEIDVRCSAGTYVRAIARDLGERLGTGAHLVALRRTRSGEFDLRHAVAGDVLDGAAERLLPLERVLVELPTVRVTSAAARLVRNGRALGRDAVLEGFPEVPPERVRVLDEDGRLLALAVPQGFGPAGELPVVPVLHPDVVLVD